MIPYPKAIHDAWLPICAVQEIKDKPLRRLLHGHPLVVFNGQNGPAVLRDRCPHRNVPLSDGQVRGGVVVCPYHGWEFDGHGVCRKIPGSDDASHIQAEVMPVHVEAGFVFSNTSETPRDFVPLPFPLGDPEYDHHIWPTQYTGSLVDGMENFLDPTHPHLMHSRIVGRHPQRVRVEVTRTQTATSVECVYDESERRRGWLPALLEGARLKGLGRFYGPTSCQIGFLGVSGPKLYITVLFSPQTQSRIQTLTTFSTPKGRVPAWLKGKALVAFHRKILNEDQVMIASQHKNLGAFGGPKYAQGPLDFIKLPMTRLMKGDALEPKEEVFSCHL